MKEQITTADKIGCLKKKIDDPEFPMDEKLEILKFFMYDSGLLGTKVDIEDFLKKLNKLTGCI